MRITRNAGSLPSRLIRLALLLVLLFGVAQLVVFRSFLPQFTPLQDLVPSFGRQSRWPFGRESWQESAPANPQTEIEDGHPIRGLMSRADDAFHNSIRDRSRTFKQAVVKYRRDHGRHPPPGFDKWYTFARERKVYNIDDFDQISNDLRPFWAIDPTELRQYAAHSSDHPGHGVATISVRNGKIFEAAEDAWRSGDFMKALHGIASYLPDMDIPMNRMDQPRVVVPWDELQTVLKVEESTRTLSSDGVVNEFTKDMSGMSKARPRSWLSQLLGYLKMSSEGSDGQPTEDSPAPEYEWFSHVNQPFMDLAAKSCPPDSHARNPGSAEHLHRAEASYTHHLGGFVTNFNLSSDLCTVGPQLSHLHGLLYASTSMLVTQKLVPIFSQCKMSVNNDILFPAPRIYGKEDVRYHYLESKDQNWNDKDDVMFWRGATSGGNAYLDAPDEWRSMHRQRLVLLTNSTDIASETTTILTASNDQPPTYTALEIQPAPFAANHTDIGFRKFIACLPNCTFYSQTFSIQEWIPFSDSFKHKYLIDIDGHSFSGRWRAYLQSRSLALKATIMREWHDSRLHAWRHFVPVDNRYGDLYSLLTYFVGYAGTTAGALAADHEAVKVPRHDHEAYKIASQGREWAAQVLRKEDMEIYCLRLLLEYRRLIDDNRDRIGYVGDGGEEMERVDRRFPAVE